MCKHVFPKTFSLHFFFFLNFFSELLYALVDSGHAPVWDSDRAPVDLLWTRAMPMLPSWKTAAAYPHMWLELEPIIHPAHTKHGR